MKQPAVYILGDERPTLYIGVTSDLVKRVWQHKEKVVDGFSSKYGLNKLLFFELHDSMEEAILREKRLKKWNRAWKLRLIKGMNPELNDLFENIAGDSRLRGDDEG